VESDETASGNGSRRAVPRRVPAAPLAHRRGSRRGDGPGDRSKLQFLLELAETALDGPPAGTLSEACRHLARALGARRCSVFWGDGSAHVAVLVSATVDGPLGPEDWALMCSAEGPPPLVGHVLSTGRPAIAGPSSEELVGPWWAEVMHMGRALAVPMGDDGSLVVDSDRPFGCTHDQVLLALATAQQLTGVAERMVGLGRGGPRDATGDALHQLLQTGVRACSPLEAAQALASAASKALGAEVACALLVDNDGRINQVATEGVGRELAEDVKSRLIGLVAAASPAWQRTFGSGRGAPDMLDDTRVAGVVRPGGAVELLGLQSAASIPVLSSDGPLGLVLCGDRARRHWRDADRAVLAQLALAGAVVVDNARLREAERYEASHDALTGLLNRRAFSELFRDALAESARTERPLAVLMLDLDGFKEVNDHYGHRCGDDLLTEIGRRLRASLREGDFIARMGGDEFAVVLTNDGEATAAHAVATRVKATLERPVQLGRHTVTVEASVGVAVVAEHGHDPDDLLQGADMAMYAAKRRARPGPVLTALDG
jgi:diguanylate cyclase (GGDEF)-like protein